MGRKSQFTQEFQDNAVRLVVADGMTYAAAARQLGITPAKLRSWVHKWKREAQLAQENHKDSFLQERVGHVFDQSGELLHLGHINAVERAVESFLKGIRSCSRDFFIAQDYGETGLMGSLRMKLENAPPGKARFTRGDPAGGKLNRTDHTAIRYGGTG